VTFTLFPLLAKLFKPSLSKLKIKNKLRRLSTKLLSHLFEIPKNT
jgi:hypothetical protein